jgi:hypothetical protein
MNKIIAVLDDCAWSDIIDSDLMPKIFNGIVEYLPIDKINSKFLYIIPIRSPSFFNKNKDIGFSRILEKYKNNIMKGPGKIVLFKPFEGHSGMSGPGWVNNDYKIISDWIYNENLPLSVYYIHGNLIENNFKYNFKILPIQMFEKWNSFTGDIIDFNPVNDKYLFLCYNRRFSECRLFLINELMNKKLFNNGYISLGIPNKNHQKYTDFNHYDNPEYDYDNIVNNLPFLIDNKTVEFNLAKNIEIEDYKRTFISIVSETLVECDTLFISEKTWKPIMVGHPFIIYGNPNTLKYLKELGYKTFDRWIDESYDLEKNWVIRCKMIVNEIDKLNKYSIDELKNIRNEMFEICNYNKNHFNELLKENYIGTESIVLGNILDYIWNNEDL